MSRLDELKSSPDVGRPERIVTVCVSGRLVRELEEAAADLDDARAELADEKAKVARSDDEPVGPPKRAGESRSRVPELERRVADAKAKVDAVQGRMRENSIDLTIRALSEGDWREWVLRHPARMRWVRTGGSDEEPEGEERFEPRDIQGASGVCNVDALVADLHLFIAKYDGEDPSDAWWTFLNENVAGGDRIQAAKQIVAMHENTVNVGKARKPSPINPGSATASE